MATNDEKRRRADSGTDAGRRLEAHPEQGRIGAYHEPERLVGHTPEDDVIVPAVTADVDEVPRVIKYGAAVLLGLAFGVGCYVWANGGVPSAPQNPGHRLGPSPTEAYFAQYGAYDNPALEGVLVDPFNSPFEPSLDPNGTAAGAELREAALSESVEPVAPGDYTVQKANTEYVAVSPSDSKVVYLFEYDSSTVPETAELTAIASKAKAKGLTLDVRAYTDEHGRLAYNRRLSERRARAIGDYLIEHGVPASKVSVHGMGPTDKYGNDRQDRRAEVIVVND